MRGERGEADRCADLSMLRLKMRLSRRCAFGLRIDIVDLKSNSVAVSITGHSAPVTAISAHPEKARFATVSEDTFVNVWELKGEEVSVVQSTSITKKLGTGIKYCQGAKLLAVTFFDDSSIYFLTTM